MNMVFRVVRRKSDGRLVVASELAKSAVRGLGSTMALLVALMAFNSARAASDVVVDASQTNINLTSPNTTGVAVEINAPDSNGISHNKYTRFSVDTDGVVLNNVTSDLGALTSSTTQGAATTTVQSWSSTTSQVNLGANTNFTGTTPASVILNEVLTTGGALSNLTGPLEIAGHEAAVIVANPYGITVKGASFVNASDVVLATGSIASTTGGDISFQLSDELLSVLDTTTSGQTSLSAADLALIGRSIAINGKIEAEDLRLVSNNGQAVFDTSDGSITTNSTGANSTAAPTLAIDSSALGGMYANAISIIANESGTGVRVRGDMVALGDTISISANGELTIGDGTGVNIEARTITTSAGDTTFDEAVLTARGNAASSSSDGGTLTISSTGDVTLSDGGLYSTASGNGTGGDLTINAVDLVDSASASESTRSAGGDLRVNLTGDASIDNAIYAGASIDLDAGTLTLGAAGTLNSSGAANIDTTGDISIGGTLDFGNDPATQTASTVASSAGDVDLAAGSGVTGDSVTFSADGALDVASTASLATRNNLTLVGDAVSVLPSLSVNGNLVVGDSATSSVVLGASGVSTTVSVGGTLAANAADLDVFSDVSVTGAATLAGNGAASILDIKSDSQFTANGGLTLTGDDLVVAGTVVQPGAISVDVSGDIQVSATGALTTTQSANITLLADGSVNNANVIRSAGTLTVGDGANGSSLTNTGTLQSAGNLTIDVADTIYNKAVVSSTENGRNLGNYYDETVTPAVADANDTYEQRLLIDETQIGLIKSTAGTVTLAATNTVNEGEVSSAGTLDISGTSFRSQLAGIYDGTLSSLANDTRAELFSTAAKYDYVNQGGIESYNTDQYLLTGRPNYSPVVDAAAVTGTLLNIGGSIEGGAATQANLNLTDVDVGANRSLTTISTPVTPPNTDSDVAVTADAPIVADGNTETSVQLASNNATWVVNIAQPNATGLSNNTYSLFNINTNGAILNNMPFSQSVTVVTDLSAEIIGNPTLLDPATVILNQVFSTGPSKLNGFLEVAGSSADVLIVNPLGIVCDSCGAINIDRLDMVVGSVSLSGGSVTTLNSTTSSADFRLVGAGMDATNTGWISIIAPEAIVDGSLNAKKLYIGLGSGSYTRSANGYARATTGASTDSQSLLVSETGGMFADQVTIDSQSSSQNPTLRVFGEIAANSGDLDVSADGIVSITGRMSASNDLSVVTTSSGDSKNVAAADIQLINGALTSGNDMVLTADTGSLVFNGGQLYSFNDLTLDSLTLVDEATGNPAEFNNTRFAGGLLQFNVDNDIIMRGTSWEADTFLFDAYGTLTLDVGEGTVLKALTLMDMNLKTLLNDGTIASLDRSTVDASSKVTNLSNGVVSSVNSSTLTVPVFDNAGKWIGASADTATGSVIWAISSSIYNRKGATVSAADSWSITGGASATNKGTITSDLSLDAALASLTNSGDITLSLRDSAETSEWTVNTLNNQDAGTLFAGGDWVINSDGARGASVTNTGTLQGYHNLSVYFDTLDLPQGEEISGALAGTAGDQFTITITNATTLESLLFSNADMAATFDAGLNVTTQGAIAANGSATVAAMGSGADIVNYGFIYAGNDLSLNADDRIGNFATVTTTLGRVLGRSAVDGKLYVEMDQVEQARAEIRAGGDLTIGSSATDLFVNSSEVRAGGNLNVSAVTLSNQVQRTALDGFVTNDPVESTVNRKLNYRSSETSYDFYTYPDNNTMFEKTETWQEFDYFKDGVPAVTPIMLAGNGFDITGTTVNNYGGVIQSSAGDSSIDFTNQLNNDALALTREDWKKVSTREINYIALGPLKYGDTGWQGADPTAPIAITEVSADAGWSPLARIEALNGTLTLSGGSVVNAGSFTEVNSSKSATGDAALDPLGFTLAIVLPTSPNGFFVTNRDPSAAYLVEMNPKLQPGISTLGSDYLMENLNINTDTTIKRLGDASYEAYLVEQQLIEATGSSLLAGYDNIADTMKGFMDNAASAAGTLGLAFGKPLTEEQLEALEDPIVWMVEVEIDGQVVLAPKVYLPKKITEEIEQQTAVISATDLNMNVATLDNLGGSIEAKENLDITAQGDINNISGSISGNNVSLESTEGNINNETFNQYGGNENVGQTVIGKTAGISANNDLNLKAAGDITNLGAEMNAGNNANLDAGGDITFDTIENETRTYDLTGSSNGLSSTVTESRTKTIEQVRSGLNVGGNLTSNSGGDTTFAGTDVNVGGDADINSEGEINIIARENSVETSTKSQTAGIGVGGGILGIQTTTTDTLSIRNQASNFNVGGNASFDAEEDMTIQGSNLNVGGDTEIDAQGLNVLAGRDLDQSSTKTETATIGISVESEENVDGSTSEGVTFGQVTIETEDRLSQRSVGSNLTTGGNLTVKTMEDVVLQGSEVEAGGNVDIDAEDIRLLAAQNIETVSKSKTTTKIGLYASSESGASGEAGAGADYETNAEAGAEAAGGTGSASAEAGVGGSAKAGASGSANASATVDFSRTRIDKEDTLNITNTGSAIRSGGNMNLNAENDLQLVGSELEAGGDVTLDAQNMSFEAAEDISVTTKSSESIRLGIYADSGAEGEAKASASAEASADASANGGLGAGATANAEASAGAKASAEGDAKAGVGLQAQAAKKTTTEGEINSLVSSIKAGGNLTRNAEENITDIGTDIEVGGDLNQTAETWDSLAARNEQFSETTYEETTAKVGVYVQAEGEASAKASADAEAHAGTMENKAEANAGAGAKAEGRASAGLEVQVDRLVETDKERSTQAVVSNIKVGGNLNSTTTGKTTIEGSNADVGGDINLTADELEMRAARDTNERSSTSEEINTRVAASIGVGGEAEASASVSSEDGTKTKTKAEGGVNVQAEMQFAMNQSGEQERSTTAVTSTFGGQNININTNKATTIEGANLNAEDGVNIDAESLDFKAAQNTFEASSSELSIETELKAKVGIIGNEGAKVSGSADVGTAGSQESGTEAVTGSINAGNLNITTRDDTRFEGTELNIEGDATVDAGGDITFDAARNTYQASSNSVEVGADFEVDDNVKANASVGVANSQESSSEAVTGSINTGGNLTLKSGNDITFEGTNIDAEGDAVVAAANDVTFNEARNESQSSSSNVDVSAGIDTEKPSFNVGVGVSNESEKSSEAVTGSLSAKNLTIVAGNDATFVGTEISAEENANLAAGGTVDFQAARSTYEADSTSVEVGVGMGKASKTTTSEGASKTKQESAIELGVEVSRERENIAQAGSISAGNGINISSGEDMNFEGTNMDAGDGIALSAGGDVNFRAAESTSSSTNVGVGLGLANETESETKDGKTENGKTGKLDASLDLGLASSREQEGSTLNAGNGGITIQSGGDVNLQGTQMDTEGAASIEAAGSINETAATSESSEFGLGLEVKAEVGMGGDESGGDSGSKSEGGDAKAADSSEDAAKSEEPAKTEEAAPTAETEGDAKPAEGEAKAEEGAEEDDSGNKFGMQASASIENESSSQGVEINAAGGVTKSEGVLNGQVVGTSQTVTASVRADGTQTALIPGAIGIPAGTEVALTGPNGETLPDWVEFDSLTGSISAKPPADFEGELPIVVEVPQRDGSVKKVGVIIGAN